MGDFVGDCMELMCCLACLAGCFACCCGKNLRPGGNAQPPPAQPPPVGYGGGYGAQPYAQAPPGYPVPYPPPGAPYGGGYPHGAAPPGCAPHSPSAAPLPNHP